MTAADLARILAAFEACIAASRAARLHLARAAHHIEEARRRK